MDEKTMHSVRVHEFGGPDKLTYEEVAVPEPGPSEVLVRVVAAAANPPDWYAREGMPGVPRELVPGLELPLALGTDVSGVIEALGEDAEGFAVGDEVFGMLRFPTVVQSGAYAEYVTAPVSDIAHTPRPFRPARITPYPSRARRCLSTAPRAGLVTSSCSWPGGRAPT